MGSDESVDRERLRRALEEAGGNRTRAAEILGVNRATLYRWMERLGIGEVLPKRIGDRYEVVRLLGSGGQATVYRVRDRALSGAERALKLLHVERLANEGLARLRREFQTLALLRHPGLVRVHDFGIDASTSCPYFVMDLVPGEHFAVAARGRSSRFVAAALARALEAVDHLHRHGLVHRDLKSENVLVEAGDDADAPARATVMDLWLMEDLAERGDAAGGTLPYAAPELLAGGRSSSRGDLYALGVTTYLALAERFPFEGATVAELIAAIQHGRAPAPSTVRPEVPEALDRIVMRLLEADPARRYPDAGSALEDLALAGFHPAGRAPRRILDLGLELIGREKEQAKGLGIVDPASNVPSASAVSTLAIIGEAGIGKSRLVEACASELRARGYRVAMGNCRSGTDSGLLPLVEVVTGALAGTDGTGTSKADEVLRRYPAALAVTSGAAAPSGTSTRFDRPQVLDSIVCLLTDLAEEFPLVVVVDDLHDADPLAVDVLWQLARRARRVPLRILLATRPPAEEGTPLDLLLRGAQLEGLLETLVLGPLDDSAVRLLAERTLGAARASLVADRIARLTDGHPLFVLELLRELAERGEKGLDPAKIAFPPTARETIAARLERVPEIGTDVLRALAVAGRPATVPELTATAGEDASRALAEAVEREFVRETVEGATEFRHAFYREAVLDGIPVEERGAWHRRWARTLAAEPAALVERAEHLLAAGAGAEAHDAFAAAGEKLLQSWRPRVAVRLLRAALDSLPSGSPERLAALERLGRACREAYDPRRGAEVCREWAAHAHELGDAGAEARAQALLGAQLRESEDAEGSVAAARRGVELARATGDPAILTRATKILISVLRGAWRHEEYLPLLDDARAAIQAAATHSLRGTGLYDLGHCFVGTGRVYEGLRVYDDARDELRAGGERVWYVLTRFNESLDLARTGDLEGACAILRRALDEIRTLGVEAPVAVGLDTLCFLLLRAGRYSEVIRTAQELQEEATRNASSKHRVIALLAAGEALAHLDESDSSREHHRLAHDLAVTAGEERQRLFACLAKVRDLRMERRLDAAEELARQVHDAAGPIRAFRQRFRAAVELGRLALDRGDCALAHRWLDVAESMRLVSSDDWPTLGASLLLERSRAWDLESKAAFAITAVDEGLGLVRWRGPVHVEVELLSARARLLGSRGDAAGAARSIGEAARRIREVAELQDDTLRRARFLARPDYAAILEAASRGASEEGPPPAIGGGRALASLYEVSHTVAAGGDLSPLFDRIVRLAVELSGGERAVLLLRDEATGEPRPTASTAVEKETEENAISVSRSVLEKADQSGSLLVADTRSDPDLGKAASVALFGIRSVMCVPVRIGDDLLGTLYVDTRRASAFFSREDLRFLQALADQAAVALAYGRTVGRLSEEREAFRRTAVETYRFGNLIGQSAAMRKVFGLLERVSGSNVPVLIHGESGTGKELVARAVHFNSPRKERVFLSENCAAMPENLLESVLFGHVRGAFTGADRDRKGLFELANGGTLFLDEVGDMSPSMQAKLLRVVESGEFRPVGSEKTSRTDVRLVSATHRDLQGMVREERFRQDLYFRLNGVTVELPPLRERKEDVPLLFEHFLERECESEGRTVPEVSAAAMRVMLAHDWPGNVRELEHVVRRSLLFASDGRIGLEALGADPTLAALARSVAPTAGTDAVASRPEQHTAKDAREDGDLEENRMRSALERAKGDVERAAALLGVSRATLYRRIKKLGLLGKD